MHDLSLLGPTELYVHIWGVVPRCKTTAWMALTERRMVLAGGAA